MNRCAVEHLSVVNSECSKMLASFFVGDSALKISVVFCKENGGRSSASPPNKYTANTKNLTKLYKSLVICYIQKKGPLRLYIFSLYMYILTLLTWNSFDRIRTTSLPQKTNGSRSGLRRINNASWAGVLLAGSSSSLLTFVLSSARASSLGVSERARGREAQQPPSPGLKGRYCCVGHEVRGNGVRKGAEGGQGRGSKAHR